MARPEPAMSRCPPSGAAKDALGFTHTTNRIPATTRMTWISLLAIVIGSLTLAAWVFLRAQGVETWESTSPATLDDCALNFRDGCVADCLCRHELRQPGAARKHCSCNSRALPLGNGGGAGRTWRPTPQRCCNSVLNREDMSAPGHRPADAQRPSAASASEAGVSRHGSAHKDSG